MLVDVISHILPTLLAGPSNSLWKHHGLKAVASRTVYPTGLLFIFDIREHHQAGGFNAVGHSCKSLWSDLKSFFFQNNGNRNDTSAYSPPRIIHVYSVKGIFPVMKGTFDQSLQYGHVAVCVSLNLAQFQCNRHDGPLFGCHALTLLRVKWTYMIKLQYQQGEILCYTSCCDISMLPFLLCDLLLPPR